MKKCGVAALLALVLCAGALGAQARGGDEMEKCFDRMRGAAVFLNADGGELAAFNPELAESRASPCETFEFVLALLGLEEDEAPETDGADFAETWGAARATREAPPGGATAVDPVAVAAALEALAYGNQDAGARTSAFWLDGPLRISPREQAEALRRAYEGEAGFANEAVRARKGLPYTGEAGGYAVYGRAGGAYDAARRCTDAWFIGLAERGAARVYFAVHLDDPQSPEASPAKARGIALDILQTCGEAWG